MRNSISSKCSKIHYLKLLVCLIACFSCGIIDGFTLLFKGFFLMLQTGNLIYGVSYSVQGQFEYLAIYLPVIFTFILTLLLSDFIEDKFLNKTVCPSNILNIVAIILLSIIVCIPIKFGVEDNSINFYRFDLINIIIYCMFSSIGALLYRSFNKLDVTIFTSTMMTANLSRLSSSFYKGIIKKEINERNKFIEFIFIILCFSSGVAVYAIFHKFYILEKFNGLEIVTMLPNLILLLPIFLLIISTLINFSISKVERNCKYYLSCNAK